MIEIGFSSSFKRAYRKTIKDKIELEHKFWQKIEIFKTNPFDDRLKTHKLSDKLKDLWSFSIDFDIRVLFCFTDENKALFVNIGKHDIVY